MPLPTNPRAYTDVAAVLDAALAVGGARYTPPANTRGAAINWAQRAYTFRKLLQRNAAPPGHEFGPTEYDSLKFRVDGSSVIIERSLPTGGLTDLEGNPIEAKEADIEIHSPKEIDPDLLEAAKAARRSLLDDGD